MELEREFPVLVANRLLAVEALIVRRSGDAWNQAISKSGVDAKQPFYRGNKVITPLNGSSALDTREDFKVLRFHPREDERDAQLAPECELAGRSRDEPFGDLMRDAYHQL